jgi:hypothetical protein
MYSLALRVKEKIQSLCEDDEALAEDPNALLQAMKDESFIEYVSLTLLRYFSSIRCEANFAFDEALGTFQV